MKEPAKPAVVYFALVFGAGFALGLVRVPFLVPRIGERYAELLEMPFMLVAIVLAARFVVRRYPLARTASSSLAVGTAALALLLVAEWQLGLWLQGRSFSDYLTDRDPVSGAVYALMLLVFALMPRVAARQFSGCAGEFPRRPACVTVAQPSHAVTLSRGNDAAGSENRVP